MQGQEAHLDADADTALLFEDLLIGIGCHGTLKAADGAELAGDLLSIGHGEGYMMLRGYKNDAASP